MTAHLEQTNVAFPKLTGCGTFKGAIDTLLELPRNDIEMALDFALTQDEETCEPPQTGTPPNCVTPDPVITLKSAIKGPKVLKGKKGKYRVVLTNTGDTAASNVRVCLSTPKRLIKGKARRCAVVPTVPAGKATFKEFTITKKTDSAARKVKKFTLKATATYKDGAGATRTTPVAKYTAIQGKTGKASGK